MADKRIYNLTDEQISYSPKLKLAVDDPTFTNTKKISIDVIYPLTNTLSAAGNFNPATQLLRMDNGSGGESKVTVNAMLTDGDVVTTIVNSVSAPILGSSSALAFTGTSDSNFTGITINGRKLGDVFLITGKATSVAAAGLKYFKTVTGYVSPGFTVYCVGAYRNATITESVNGYITAAGDIYFETGKVGAEFVFSLTAIIG